MSFLAEFRPILNSHFRQIHDLRDPTKVLYNRETLVWAALLGYVLRRDTRNKMDCARNDVALAESVLRLSG